MSNAVQYPELFDHLECPAEDCAGGLVRAFEIRRSVIIAECCMCAAQWPLEGEVGEFCVGELGIPLSLALDVVAGAALIFGDKRTKDRAIGYLASRAAEYAQVAAQAAAKASPTLCNAVPGPDAAVKCTQPVGHKGIHTGIDSTGITHEFGFAWLGGSAWVGVKDTDKDRG